MKLFIPKIQPQQVLFFIATVSLILCALTLAERVFHNLAEIHIYASLQRIHYGDKSINRNITIVDTSPIYNMKTQSTERGELADLIEAIDLGTPKSIGIDIILENQKTAPDSFDVKLKKVISKAGNVIIPSVIDPICMAQDGILLANIKIRDGYEIPVQVEDHFSLPFLMAASDTVALPRKNVVYYANYRADDKALRNSGQIIDALEIIELMKNQKINLEEKTDQLGLLFASQYVLVGFCNTIFNKDLHNTPIGPQPGVVIWANVLHTLLSSHDSVSFDPFWLRLIWAFVLSCLFYVLRFWYRNNCTIYPIYYGFLATLFIVLVFASSYFMYSLSFIYSPLFTILFVGLAGFPAYLQFMRLSRFNASLLARKRSKFLPPFLARAYCELYRENSPFRRLHIAFTIFEECLRFSVLLGFSQIKSYQLNISGLSSSGIKRYDFRKLTLGQLQLLLRHLMDSLKACPEILEEWKLIYLAKDDKDGWHRNEFAANIEENITRLLKVDGISEFELELKKYIDKKLTNVGIDKIGWLQMQKIRIKAFFKSIPISSTKQPADKIQKIAAIFADTMERDQAINLFNLRNRMIHQGGAFLPDEECRTLLKILIKYVDIFLFEKLAFSRELSFISAGDQPPLKLKYNSTLIDPFPFMLAEKCPFHNKAEVFWLTAIDDRKCQFDYIGTDPVCRLHRLAAKEEIEELFKWMGLS